MSIIKTKMHEKYFIQSKKVGFRPYENKFAKLIADWINDPEINIFFPQPIPHSQKKMEKCIENLEKSSNEVGFVVFDIKKDIPIGILEIRKMDFNSKNCALEIALGNKKFFNKGYGTAIIALAHEYIFNELMMHKITMHMMSSNESIKKLAVKMGYSLEGILREEWAKKGEYHDVLVMSLLRNRCNNERLNHIPKNVLGLIGNTPVVEFKNIGSPPNVRLFGKLEFMNPSGSVKDRAAFEMITAAEKQGKIDKDTTIIECTSGNTGIGIAMICAIKNLKCILVAPEGVIPLGKLKLMESLGAELIQTPIEGDYELSIKVSEKISKKIKNSFVPHQFDNPFNVLAHKKNTVKEIISTFGADLDAIVCAVGSGGTLTGVGEAIKEFNPNIEMIAVEPKNCAALSGGPIKEHFILGIGAGFIPKILNQKIIDKIITVSDEEAAEHCLKLARQEGIFCGISSGAALAGALRYAREQSAPKNVLIMIPDNGVRYGGKQGFFMDYFDNYVKKNKKVKVPVYE